MSITIMCLNLIKQELTYYLITSLQYEKYKAFTHFYNVFKNNPIMSPF